MTSEMAVFLSVFALVTIVMMIGLRFVKSQKIKDMALKVLAWLCFLFHISVMWQSSLTNGGTGTAPSAVLWPLYFCNVTMYLLLVVAQIDKKSKVFKALATFVAYAGIIGTIVTFVDYNFPFAYDDGIYSFERMKSTVSHAFMMMGSIYLFVGGYVKIRLKNIGYFVLGVLFNGLVGVAVNWYFITYNINTGINAMWLRHTAMDGVPFLNGIGLAAIAVGLMVAFSLVWELIAVPIAKRKGMPEKYFWQEFEPAVTSWKAKLKTTKGKLQTAALLLFVVGTVVLVFIQSTVHAY